MTNEEIFALQAEAKRFRETKIGGLLQKFESAHARAWQTDSREAASDASMKRDWDASDAARQELIAAIKEAQVEIEALRASIGNVDRERETIAAKAREYAEHYPPHSDGRNTFVILAEWIESRKSNAA